MPLIFIHGVNTRYDDKEYRQNKKTRDILIERYLLQPLRTKGTRFQGIKIADDAYWGEYGVDPKWQWQSLPDYRVLENLGASNSNILQSGVELQLLLENNKSGTLETKLLDELQLKIAADNNLTRLIETLLLPVILSEQNLCKEAEKDPEKEGTLQALLVMAGWEVANDSKIQSAIKTAKSDTTVLQLLKKKIQQRFEQLVLSSELVSQEPVDDERLEQLGRKPSLRWLKAAKDKVGELFDQYNPKNVIMRISTKVTLQRFREDWHLTIARFLGDVFVYLNERDNDKPQSGLIISTVLKHLNKALKEKKTPKEPLIVITHSMGGNIFYDILTHYQPDLQVDVWVSVGGQVGVFEEMKIFKGSNKDIGAPDKVKRLKNVGCWLNVYDPIDIFSFRAEPIFEGVKDIPSNTIGGGLKPHNAYFLYPKFYKDLYLHIEKALS